MRHDPIYPRPALVRYRQERRPSLESSIRMSGSEVSIPSEAAAACYSGPRVTSTLRAGIVRTVA